MENDLVVNEQGQPISDSSAVIENPQDSTITAEVSEVNAELYSDTCIVICEYLPKLYVISLILLGSVVFAFFYKSIKTISNHFV